MAQSIYSSLLTPPRVRARNDSFHEDDDIDVDISAPISSEDEELLRQIANENREDDVLANDTANRGALLASPLLMAAAAAALNNSNGLSIPVSSSEVRSNLPDVQPYTLTFSDDEDGKEDEGSTTDSLRESDFFMDAETNEDDMQFGKHRDFRFDTLELQAINSAPAPIWIGDPLENIQEVEMEVDPDQNDEDHVVQNTNGIHAQDPPQTNYAPKVLGADDQEKAAFRRKLFFLFGWFIAAILVCTAIGVVVAGRNKGEKAATTMPAPSRPTPEITLSPIPTTLPSSRLPTTSPSQSQSPTNPGETRRPTLKPSLRPSMRPSLRPTPRPTSRPSTPPTIKPSNLPSITPTTLAPTRNPTQSPVLQLPSSPPILPTTAPASEPSQLQTLEPTALLTVGPTFSAEEDARRSEITALLVDISGIDVVLDPLSPQSMAHQWILNDDSLRLSVENSSRLVQRYALATMYFSTNANNTWLACGPSDGPSPCPTVEQRFLSDSSECQWLGVTCDTEVITALNLRENGLRGKLQGEISELSQLNSIIFSRNELTGSIPTDLGRLSILKFLLLNRNELRAGIPTALGKLSSLFYLHLGDNLLTGTVPPEIFVGSMQHLDVGGNRLRGTIPEDLTINSPSLINIDIANNMFRGTMPQLASLPFLSTFTAGNNTFTGTLPVILSTVLSVFDVGQNQLAGGLPTSLFDLGNSLATLNLEQNIFSGEVSSLFGQLTTLEQLRLLGNDFTGTIPSTIGLLTSLQEFQVEQTLLVGTMPEAVCALRQGLLQSLSADCGATPPEVECQCCSLCFV